MKPLVVPYPRPTSLSDPFDDFTSKAVEGLLSISDVDLTDWDLQQIIGPYVPAGNYREAVYFLPMAFSRLERSGDQATALMPSITWFISEYCEELNKDGLLEACEERVELFLQKWSSDFVVIHYDKAACSAKKWQINYFDEVAFSDTIIETILNSQSSVSLKNITHRFVETLANSLSFVQAAWFIEIARQFHVEDIEPGDEKMMAILLDRTLIKSRVRFVAEYRDQISMAPTYWSGIFEIFGIDT